jgi:hypothetical protein
MFFCIITSQILPEHMTCNACLCECGCAGVLTVYTHVPTAFANLHASCKHMRLGRIFAQDHMTSNPPSIHYILLGLNHCFSIIKLYLCLTSFHIKLRNLMCYAMVLGYHMLLAHSHLGCGVGRHLVRGCESQSLRRPTNKHIEAGIRSRLWSGYDCFNST